MIQASTLKFIKNLARNNSKEWFDKNRKAYDAAKDDVCRLATDFINAAGRTDLAIKELQTKDCMFRINRDVRFSKDKSPYKTNMSVYLSPGGKKSSNSGFYFHIEPGKAFAAAGLWQPEPKQLAAIREEIDYSFDDWQKILNNKRLKTIFTNDLSKEEMLSRPPKGYEADNPAIEFVKRKSFVLSFPLSDEDLMSKTLLKKLTAAFEASADFRKFLDRAGD